MSAYPTGIGNAQQALQATAAMRQEPWYQQLLLSWGLDPRGDSNGNVHLGEAQQEALLNAARQRGIGISDSYHIDENGQIAENGSHWLRNTLVGAGIGAATLTGLGAAGIGPLSGLFGAGAGATGAGVGIGETGATWGIPSATALGLPVTAAETGAGLLPATAINAGLFTAPSSIPSGAVPAALAGGSGTGSLVGSATQALLGSGKSNINPIVGAITALGSALGGHYLANATGANNVPPQLTDLLNQSVQRQKELAPLGTAATAGMYQMLPDFAKTPASVQGAQSLLGVKANG